MDASIEDRNPVPAASTPERVGWGGAAPAGLGALPLSSCRTLPLALVSLGVGGVFIARLGVPCACEWLTFAFAAGVSPSASGEPTVASPAGRGLRAFREPMAGAACSLGHYRHHRAGDHASRSRPIDTALLTRPETRPMLFRSLALTALAALALPASAKSTRASTGAPGPTCPSRPFIAGRSIDTLEGVDVPDFEAGDGGTESFAVRQDDRLLDPKAEAAIEADGVDMALVGIAS